MTEQLFAPKQQSLPYDERTIRYHALYDGSALCKWDMPLQVTSALPWDRVRQEIVCGRKPCFRAWLDERDGIATRREAGRGE